MRSQSRLESSALSLCGIALMLLAMTVCRHAPIKPTIERVAVDEWGQWPWLLNPPIDQHRLKMASEKSPPEATHIGEVRPVFAVFDNVDLSDKHWIKVESGPADWGQDSEGWLLEVTVNEVRLLDRSGEIETFRRPQGIQRLRFPEQEWVDLSLAQSQNDIAWRVTLGSFPQYCVKFLADSEEQQTKEADNDRKAFEDFFKVDMFVGLNDRFARIGRVVTASRLGAWAAQRGHHDLSASLFHLATAALKQCEPYGYFNMQDSHLRGFVVSRLVEQCRRVAVSKAHNLLEPRDELVRFWRRAARLPDQGFQTEARHMIEGYESLLAEDVAWKEPTSEEFDGWPPAEQARYWLHHLRDANVYQSSNPGRCAVTEPWTLQCFHADDPLPGLRDAQTKNRRNPAFELVKLGEAALPLVREHLRDSRPTRCEEHWRWYWPDGWKLVRYSECCQQIVTVIERNQRRQVVLPAKSRNE